MGAQTGRVKPSGRWCGADEVLISVGVSVSTLEGALSVGKFNGCMRGESGNKNIMPSTDGASARDGNGHEADGKERDVT